MAKEVTIIAAHIAATKITWRASDPLPDARAGVGEIVGSMHYLELLQATTTRCLCNVRGASRSTILWHRPLNVQGLSNISYFERSKTGEYFTETYTECTRVFFPSFRNQQPMGAFRSVTEVKSYSTASFSTGLKTAVDEDHEESCRSIRKQLDGQQVSSRMALGSRTGFSNVILAKISHYVDSLVSFS